MSTRDETILGVELCRLLERDRAMVSIGGLAGVHLRIRGAAGELLSHLALTPSRARSLARWLIAAADRLDPDGAQPAPPILLGIERAAK